MVVLKTGRKGVCKHGAGALFGLTLAGLVAAVPVTAEVPIGVQAAVLKRVFDYDEHIRRPLQVVVVYAGEGMEAAEDVVAAFASLEVAARAVPLAKAEEELVAASAAYLLTGTDTEGVRAAVSRHRVLSVAGEATLAEEGRVAVAVGLSDRGTPEIVVHLPRLESEGHALPARVLALARVVRGDQES